MGQPDKPAHFVRSFGTDRVLARNDRMFWKDRSGQMPIRNGYYSALGRPIRKTPWRVAVAMSPSRRHDCPTIQNFQDCRIGWNFAERMGRRIYNDSNATTPNLPSRRWMVSPARLC